MRLIAYVFPGQGAQKPGMGRDLFEKFPRLTQAANEILGYSIVELCRENPLDRLNQTQYTQPALYVVSSLDYLDNLQLKCRRPDFVAGHSLGEYAALFAAGVFNFQTGLRLVQRRGALMAEMTESKEASMVAILGMDVDSAAEILIKHGLPDTLIANDNSPVQVVLSGYRTDLERAKRAFENTLAQVIPLNVTGAFHCPLMTQAQREFSAFLEPFTFFEPVIPVISSVDAQPYEPETTKHRLTQQITSPVQWTQTVRYLQQFGDVHFRELGGSRVLTKLINQTLEYGPVDAHA
jgi:malonyl CoA-acyl carrier protein transacylase